MHASLFSGESVATLEDRVVQAFTTVGLSEAAGLRAIGASKNQLARWKEGQKMPVESLLAVVRVCAERGLLLNGHWLLTGSGAMRLAEVELAYGGIKQIVELVDTSPTMLREALEQMTATFGRILPALPGGMEEDQE